ncbi:TPA: TraI/MobA(P) family conjugative relaxase [Legionella anisa]|uniref:TraI/MobA(P) family conjugative relaxase n=1 Tax=Legionella anisa TaxID=28082 RepID=UPI0022437283|nr:TraI/MobA(P) family conjugative relaxase [Legionella anisa]MCW8423094.1 relaxase/mobilization nuclease domain-containing protein [Legionella anisa]
MIIRHIPMKSARLSSFSSLVRYIVDTQNKQERVGGVSIANCNSVDSIWAIQEVLATQAKNQRAQGDKTYHLLISFAPGETLSEHALKTIEDRVVSSIGFKEHQRISAVHHDSDNLHMHIAINKIHPKSLKMIEPYRAYRTFAEVASTLEVEFGLQITNHQTRKGRSENLADDMEQHSGIESLINWMKRNCREQIDSAKSWVDVHKILEEHGITIQLRGNGFVFCNANGLMVKASSISRDFSKKNLLSKLGEFEPSRFNGETPTQNTYRYEPLNKSISNSELYALYRYERGNNKENLSKQLKILRRAKALLIDKAKRKGRVKRAALKLMRISKTQKKYLYQFISKTLIGDIAHIQKNYTKQRQQLIDSHQNKTWADWLKSKAQSGDSDALIALRFQNRKNKSKYNLSGVKSDTSPIDFKLIDSITKEGTEIYKVDRAVIRNNGKFINIFKGGSIATLKHALELARKQYGNCIKVNGSPLFKKIILQIVIQNKIPITFADLDMESQRQKLILEQEKLNEHTRRNGFNNGGRASGNNEALRTIISGRIDKRGFSTGSKSNPYSISRGSPAESQNSMRNLSQLALVQLTGRGEVLLPDNAYDKLERQGVKPDNYVRRNVSRINDKGVGYKNRNPC